MNILIQHTEISVIGSRSISAKKDCRGSKAVKCVNQSLAGGVIESLLSVFKDKKNMQATQNRMLSKCGKQKVKQPL